MSAATSFYSTFQQLTLSLGICISSAVLTLTIFLFGHSGPQLSDFSIAFLVVTAISFMASPICARMPFDAGNAMSGYRPSNTSANTV